MGHSIRSKRKRAFRAIKRERYALKERANLDQILEKSNLTKYVEELKASRQAEDMAVQEEKPAETEVTGGLSEMRDLEEESKHKKNWDSKNSIRRRRKKEKELKRKSKKGKNYKFAKGGLSKSSW